VDKRDNRLRQGHILSTSTAPRALTLFATNKLNPATGYGKLERGLLMGFEQLGVFVPHFTNKPRKMPDGVILVAGLPTNAERLPKSARLIAYTMSESTRVSRDWVDILNSRYEAVIVPCPGLVEVYRDSGVSIPVHCVPLGVDYQPPPYTRRDASVKQWRFLTYSYGDSRKGAHLSIMAFKRVFHSEHGVKLIVKARDNHDASWLAGCEDAQIEIVGGEQSEQDWHALLASCHAMIYPSQGEGFGLPPREAVLSGMPVISSSWLGLFDAHEWGYPLPVKRMMLAQFDAWEANAEGALWAMPDDAMIDTYLRHITANYSRALRRARQGREYLLTNFKWKQTARRVLEIVA
jgi:glycosyltransferase involved in cell wall biosynthesis